MVHKTVIVALTVLLVAAVSTFVGVFFGVGSRKPPSEHSYRKAAVAADAGKCSQIGRLELSHKATFLPQVKMHKHVHTCKLEKYTH